uniref:Major facilitator superfamily (MFS) profile domain-containing protein n=1 Tax=Phaeomonas parva TaxID=124430 RepID=A0A7S1U9Q8_9STRA|mmetsp:Transcript_36812/g.115251  ORF Transcript_36812/g.115251 Transcript_36812/m.115251 type:complete len:588 (+) Transcript_36812:324-2087(+)
MGGGPALPDDGGARVDGPGGWCGWALFILVFSALFFMNMSLSVVMTVLPDIAEDFGTDVSAAIWVTIATNLLAVGMLPASGRLGDVLGHRRVWVAGMALRLCCLFASGSAPRLWVLVVSRALSGVGGALDEPSGTAMILRSFKYEQRPFFLGLSTAITAAAQPLGLVIGGFVAKYLGWRWLFYAPLIPMCFTFVFAVMLLYGPYSPLEAEPTPARSGFIPLAQEEGEPDEQDAGAAGLVEMVGDLEAASLGADDDFDELEAVLDVADGTAAGAAGASSRPGARAAGGESEGLKDFDVAGTMLFTTSIAVFLLFLNVAPTHGIASPTAIASGVLAPVLFAALYVVERRAAQPIIPLVLLNNKAVFNTLLAYTVMWMPYLATWLLLPLYMRDVKGLDEATVAALITVRPACNAIFNTVAGGLQRRKMLSTLSLIIIGSAFMTCGYVLLNVYLEYTSPAGESAHRGAGLWILQVCLTIMGTGVGLTFNATSSFVMNVSPEDRLANTFGVLRMVHQTSILVGYIVAQAIIGDVDPSLAGQVSPARYVTCARVILGMNMVYCLFPSWSLGFSEGKKAERDAASKGERLKSGD